MRPDRPISVREGSQRLAKQFCGREGLAICEASGRLFDEIKRRRELWGTADAEGALEAERIAATALDAMDSVRRTIADLSEDPDAFHSLFELTTIASDLHDACADFGVPGIERRSTTVAEPTPEEEAALRSNVKMLVRTARRVNRSRWSKGLERRGHRRPPRRVGQVRSRRTRSCQPTRAGPNQDDPPPRSSRPNRGWCS